MSDQALVKFLQTYGGIEAPQDPVEAATDGQMKSLSTVLAMQFTGPPGVIVDIGAGRGTLLARLVKIPDFLRSKWTYVGVENERYHKEIVGHGVDASIHKRVDVVGLDNFYESWPEAPSGAKQVVVIRNVLHELDIETTSQLIGHVASHLHEGSLLVVQDLGVFPVAEKGNACWDCERLAALLAGVGFTTTAVQEPTKSGNLWFNVVAQRTSSDAPPSERTVEMVVAARTQQWQSWADSGALTNMDIERDQRLAKIDFDLQFAALTLQLLAVSAPSVKMLTRRQEQMAAFEMFERALSSVRLQDTYGPEDVSSIRHFKDRARSQESLQAFLAGESTVAALSGPTLMGKSALVKHVLSSFGHRRKVVFMDALGSWSAWNLLESIFTGCDVCIPTEITGRMQHVEIDSISTPFKTFAVAVAPRVVIVVDHFERLLRPDSTLESKINQVFQIWGSTPGAKLIFTSRKRVPATVLPGIDIDTDHPAVGRFPEGPHVENLLSALLPYSSFPIALVDAIDRHPFMAELAGKIIDREGPGALTDARLLYQLRNKLRAKMMERVTTKLSMVAIEALMYTRTAVPREVANVLTSSASVQDALETGLVYEFPARTGQSLIGCIQGFRFDQSEDEENLGLPKKVVEIHKKWASALRDHYRKVDADPRWLRESFYHAAVSGSREDLVYYGRQFRSELQDAGEFWFRTAKDFTNALWAFERVREYSDESDPYVSMRVASCLIRTGNPAGGLALFEDLFGQYPDWTGCRTSCVDGLLFLRRFQEALDLLGQFTEFDKLTRPSDSWILGQYGRAYVGLHRLREAVAAFRRQLPLDNSPVVVRALARALHRLGLRDEEGSVLRRGHADHPASSSILAAYGTWLQNNERLEHAIELLAPAVAQKPDNAWLAFAYVQALVGADRVADARKYFRAVGHELYPPFMCRTVEAHICRSEGDFDGAIRLLNYESEDQYDTDHRIGQRAEVFVAWAGSETSSEKRARIARRALQELPHDTGNLLINISVLKLCLMADDEVRFAATLSRCKGINSESQDVSRLEAQGLERYPTLHQ